MPLTQTRAEARSKVIVPGSVAYNFHMRLEAGQFYSGVSELHFSLSEVPQDEFLIDLQIQEVTSLKVNTVETPLTFEEGFIRVDLTKLKVGANLIVVHYRHQYNNDGSGCVSFIDVDGKQYIYTQFEPYAANRVFALFDQPDIKAPMTLNVLVPTEWKRVLSNEAGQISPFEPEAYLKSAKTSDEATVSALIDGFSGLMATFKETKPLSSYLYVIVAGAYEEIAIEHPHKNIPMSLFCIESLFPYLQKLAPFVFEVTV